MPGVDAASCVEIHVLAERNLPGVDTQDIGAAFAIRRMHHDLRSNRPGRSSAGSRTSGRLVAARTITPFVHRKSRPSR